jgi:hypothetical protein
VMQDALMQTRIALDNASGADPLTVRANIVSSDFLAAAGIGLASGRDFSASDDRATPAVAIVSAAFDRLHFRDGGALGHFFTIGSGAGARTVRIVGVAHDARFDRMGEVGANLRDVETEMVYLPLTQSPRLPRTMTLVIRTTVDPVTVIHQLRQLVRRTPSLELGRVASIGQLLDDGSSRERFSAASAAAFGAVALGMALIGVLGILWYDVARRTTEIGVRTALGAQAAQTIMLVARQALTMLGAAVVLAIPLVVAVGSLVKSQLYGVAATSPVTFITGVGVLAVTTLVGCIAPSVRAARVDPIVALRGQVE